MMHAKILQIERNTKETNVYFYFRDAAYLQEPILKILQIERNTKETNVYFYFRDAANLHGANLKDTANREKYKRNESLFLFPRCSESSWCQP
jgi:hypothetical protein